MSHSIKSLKNIKKCACTVIFFIYLLGNKSLYSSVQINYEIYLHFSKYVSCDLSTVVFTVNIIS